MRSLGRFAGFSSTLNSSFLHTNYIGRKFAILVVSNSTQHCNIQLYERVIWGLSAYPFPSMFKNYALSTTNLLQCMKVSRFFRYWSLNKLPHTTSSTTVFGYRCSNISRSDPSELFKLIKYAKMCYKCARNMSICICSGPV